MASTFSEVLIIGGTGRVGSAAAIHLLTCDGIQGNVSVLLAGRNASTADKVKNEILQEVGGQDALQRRGRAVGTLSLDFRDEQALVEALSGIDAVMHTAGPYLNEQPDILAAAIHRKVPVYVDLSDPLEYLEAALDMNAAAVEAGTAAVVSAGAFPGLSNVLAVECSKRLKSPVKDLKFSYFTAGLGGSGKINLLITNLGFGEPIWTLRGGKRKPQLIGGCEPETVDFFFDKSDISYEKIGTRTVWAWPFPEVCTAAEALHISGSSDVKMGTDPDIWNVILVAMAAVIPRSWWRSNAFSNFLAWFSYPMVALTDRFVGETHGIRVDVTGEDGSSASAVQAHVSFRRCVGQSAAEFVVHLLQERQAGNARSGVYLPEALMQDDGQRAKALERMTGTPGTFTYRIETTSVAEANA